MRIFAMMIVFAVTLSACEGTTTGRKSECFGRKGVDGDYVVSRNATAHFSFIADGTSGAGYDCDYQSF